MIEKANGDGNSMRRNETRPELSSGKMLFGEAGAEDPQAAGANAPHFVLYLPSFSG